MERRLFASVIAVAAVFVLASCTAPDPPEFDRAQTDDDRPNALSSATDEVRPDSIRRAGDVDGLEIFLARGTESDDQLCVLLVRDDVWESMSCGQLGVGIETPDGTRIEAGSFSFPVDSGHRDISESVRVLVDE